MMHRVLVYRRYYLPRSETFIYEQLIGHTQVKPIILTRKTQNLHLFPFEPINQRESFIGLPHWIKQQQIRCLHARFGPAGLELLPIAKKTHLPLITSFHGFDATKWVQTYPAYRRALKKLFHFGAAFTVVSKRMYNRLIQLGCPAKKVHLIRSGIDLRKFPMLPLPPVEQEAFRLVSVGRLTPKKGMDTLIRAFARVRKRYPKATLTIVGDGEEKIRLLRLIEELGLGKIVTMKGALSHQEVQKELANAHLFTIACQTAKDGNQEGIPNVLMEAMATGRPVVSTRHAGIPELITHRVSGYLAAEKQPVQLAKMLEHALASTSDWPELIANARRKVEDKHDICKQRVKLENLYLRVIGQAR